MLHTPDQSKTLLSSQPQSPHHGEVSLKLDISQIQQHRFTFSQYRQQEDNMLTSPPSYLLWGAVVQ